MPLADGAYLTNKFEVYSLGGCVVHEIGKRLSDVFYAYKHHFWRRPTIALVSDGTDGYNFRTSVIPDKYVSYFINDVAGFHRKELENLNPEAVIVMDITRDFFTGVVEVEDGKYAMNPLDGRGMLEDINHDTMNEAKLADILRVEELKTFHPVRDTEDYFTLWEEAIVALSDLMVQRFRHVIIPEIYFSTDSLELHDGHSIDRHRAEEANPILKRMYDYVRSKTRFVVISCPAHRMVTGSDVPWGGPFPTHFIEETYALFCQEIDKVVRSLDHVDSFYLERAAFNRAEQHAREQKAKLQAERRAEERHSDIQRLEKENRALIDHSNEVVEKLNGTCVDLEANKVRLISSQSRLLEVLEENRALLERTIEAERTRDRMAAQISELRGELRKPAHYHLKKSLARATRSLRSGSR